MLARFRSRLTYANVTATVALFLAVSGGVAWALANDSVRSRHIVNGEVKGGDVKNKGLRVTDLAVYHQRGASNSVDLDIPAHSCTTNVFNNESIKAGDRVLMFLEEGESDPQVENHVTLSPQFVTEDDRLPVRACNLSATPLVDEEIPVDLVVIR